MTRLAFIFAYAANVLLTLVSLAILPERVAIHFGPGGMPDGWASSLTHTLIFLGLETIVFISLFFAPRLTTAVPAKWLNLPNKQYWLAPENRALFQEKFPPLMYGFGAAMFLFLFALGLLTTQANLAQPVRLDERQLIFCLALFLVFATGWCVVFFRSFRIPDADNSQRS